MSRVLDRLAIRSAKALGLDPCVVVVWVGWALSWHPEVRAVRREILRRVISGQPALPKRVMVSLPHNVTVTAIPLVLTPERSEGTAPRFESCRDSAEFLPLVTDSAVWRTFDQKSEQA